MALDLSTIDKDVTDNLGPMAPAAPPSGGGNATPVVPPVEPTVANAEQAELERLRKEVAELRQKQLDTDRDQRIKSAVAASNVQDSGPTAGEMNVRRQRAIAQSGGLAKWYKVSIPDRTNILLDGQRVAATVQEISKYFGPKSSAAAAVQLKASNPRAYRSYRTEAIELGWI